MTERSRSPARAKGERESWLGEIIELAVQIANEHLVPDGPGSPTSGRRLKAHRALLFENAGRRSDAGRSKLDNYQNFAKAFRVPDYQRAYGRGAQPNAARLKTASRISNAPSLAARRVRAVSLLYALLLYALLLLQMERDDRCRRRSGAAPRPD